MSKNYSMGIISPFGTCFKLKVHGYEISIAHEQPSMKLEVDVPMVKGNMLVINPDNQDITYDVFNNHMYNTILRVDPTLENIEYAIAWIRKFGESPEISR